MNLYEKAVPTGKVTVTAQRGLEVVYCAASSGIALAVSQSPSWEMEPTSLIVSPKVVLTSSLKVTAMAVA